MTEVVHKWGYEPTKVTPYLALSGELWGVFVEIWEKIDHVLMAPHCVIYHKVGKTISSLYTIFIWI